MVFSASPALPTDPGAKAGVLIPKVFPVSRDRWAEFGFDELRLRR